MKEFKWPRERKGKKERNLLKYHVYLALRHTNWEQCKSKLTQKRTVENQQTQRTYDAAIQAILHVLNFKSLVQNEGVI